MIITLSVTGLGECIYSCGDKYTGQWNSGLRWGSGRLCFNNGDRYSGSFENDKPNGEGEFLFRNNDRFIGHVKDGYFDGMGTYYYSDGREYNGSFESNFKHGHGVFTFSNKNTYEGVFMHDKCNGPGVYKYADGSPDQKVEYFGIEIDQMSLSHVPTDKKNAVDNFKLAMTVAKAKLNLKKGIRSRLNKLKLEGTTVDQSSAAVNANRDHSEGASAVLNSPSPPDHSLEFISIDKEEFKTISGISNHSSASPSLIDIYDGRGSLGAMSNSVEINNVVASSSSFVEFSSNPIIDCQLLHQPKHTSLGKRNTTLLSVNTAEVLGNTLSNGKDTNLGDNQDDNQDDDMSLDSLPPPPVLSFSLSGRQRAKSTSTPR